MTQGREPLEEAGGVFAKSREEFEEWCRLEAGDREGWARVWGPEGVDLKLASDPDVSPWIRCEGFWEAWITLGIARRIHDGATVWNIGANVGYFTAMFALLAGHRGRVVAFEPQPELAACVAASRRDARLRRIEVIDAAVGRYARKAQLFAGQTETGEVHRGGVSLFSSTKVKPIGSKVEVFAIDTLQDRFGKPDLIFCDAEGAEEEIFLGSELLTTHRPELCIEWCPQRYITPKSFVMFLNECGYSAYSFNENAIAVPFDLQASIDTDVLEQILLVPSGVAPRRRADKS